MNSTNVK